MEGDIAQPTIASSDRIRGTGRFLYGFRVGQCQQNAGIFPWIGCSVLRIGDRSRLDNANSRHSIRTIKSVDDSRCGLQQPRSHGFPRRFLNWIFLFLKNVGLLMIYHLSIYLTILICAAF